MNALCRIALVAVLVATFVAVVPVLRAASDESDWPTLVTLDQPVNVGNLVLSPGKYIFQKSHNTPDRNVVMIFSVDRNRWDGIVLGNPVQRFNTSDKFVFFKENGSETLKYWFHPNWTDGVEFRGAPGN